MWMKALEHQWFSTMYGVYYFAGSVWLTLATLYVIALVLKKNGPLSGVVHTRQFHDIGVLWLAFTVFYAYIHFSQYFIIWNANLPEETFWYNLRELNHDGTTGTTWGIGRDNGICGMDRIERVVVDGFDFRFSIVSIWLILLSRLWILRRVRCAVVVLLFLVEDGLNHDGTTTRRQCGRVGIDALQTPAFLRRACRAVVVHFAWPSCRTC
jgi:hypothetical protein